MITGHTKICDGMDIHLGGGKRTTNKILMEKALVKCPIRRQEKICQDNIKINLQVLSCEDGRQLELAEDLSKGAPTYRILTVSKSKK